MDEEDKDAKPKSIRRARPGPTLEPKALVAREYERHRILMNRLRQSEADDHQCPDAVDK